MRGSQKGINLLTSKRVPIRGIKEPLDYKIIESSDFIEYRSLVSGELHRLDGPARIHKEGYVTEWYQNGKLHRTDGPAHIHDAKNGYLETWYFEGKKHRNDGPAYYLKSKENNHESKEWYKNDKLHNWKGPAKIETFQTSDMKEGAIRSSWYVEGIPHRTDGPTHVAKNTGEDYIQYMQEGLMHREEGPAMIGVDSVGWYYKGRLGNPQGPARLRLDHDGKWQITYAIDGKILLEDESQIENYNEKQVIVGNDIVPSYGKSAKEMIKELENLPQTKEIKKQFKDDSFFTDFDYFS